MAGASFYGDTSVGTPASGDPITGNTGAGRLSPFQQSSYTRGKLGPGGLSAALGGLPSHEQAAPLMGHSAMPGFAAGVHAPVQQQMAQDRQGFARATQLAQRPASEFGQSPRIGVQGGMGMAQNVGVQNPARPLAQVAAGGMMPNPERAPQNFAANPALLQRDAQANARLPKAPHWVKPMAQARPVGVQGGMGPANVGIPPGGPGQDVQRMRAMALAQAHRQFGPGNAAAMQANFADQDAKAAMHAQAMAAAGRDAEMQGLKIEGQKQANAFGPKEQADADLVGHMVQNGMPIDAARKAVAPGNPNSPQQIADTARAGHDAVLKSLLEDGISARESFRRLRASGIPGANDPRSPIGAQYIAQLQKTFGGGIGDQLKPQNPPTSTYLAMPHVLQSLIRGIGGLAPGSEDWDHPLTEQSATQDDLINYYAKGTGQTPKALASAPQQSDYAKLINQGISQGRGLMNRVGSMIPGNDAFNNYIGSTALGKMFKR